MAILLVALAFVSRTSVVTANPIKPIGFVAQKQISSGKLARMHVLGTIHVPVFSWKDIPPGWLSAAHRSSRVFVENKAVIQLSEQLRKNRFSLGVFLDAVIASRFRSDKLADLDLPFTSILGHSLAYLNIVKDAFRQGDSHMGEQIEAYVTGDLAKLRSLAPELVAGKIMLEGRNGQWLPRLDFEARHSGEIAVAVGVGHLPDMIKRLKEGGYTVDENPDW